MTLKIHKKYKTKKILAVIFAIALILAAAVPAGPAMADGAPGWGSPELVKGRLLTASDAGDSSDWIEIARYGDYSLIVRTNYINTYGNLYGQSMYNDPNWQFVPYGATVKYADSNVRRHINNWFNGVSTVDNLPFRSKLRDYSVQNSAIFAQGTCCNQTTSMYDGLSYPTKYQVGVGNDIAFALSYSEAASFCSILRFSRGNIANIYSHPYAAFNYSKINIPDGYLKSMWLRSPGDCAGTVGALYNDYGSVGGRVFQDNISNTSTNRGYVYPALWVGSGIFEPPAPPVVNYSVTYHPNGGIGNSVTYTVAPGDYVFIYDQGYTRPGYGLAGWNTEPGGGGTAYSIYDLTTATGNLNLYAQWKFASSVVYHANGGVGADVVDYGNNGTFTIQPCMFSRPQYTFYRWTTDPAGSAAILPAGMSFSNFHGTLHLYAQWRVAL